MTRTGPVLAASNHATTSCWLAALLTVDLQEASGGHFGRDHPQVLVHHLAAHKLGVEEVHHHEPAGVNRGDE